MTRMVHKRLVDTGHGPCGYYLQDDLKVIIVITFINFDSL